MYQLRAFQEIACSNVRMHFSNCDKYKENELNIWKMPFRQQLNELLRHLNAKMSCQDYFVILYWTSILMCLVSLAYAIVEFHSTCINKFACGNPTTFLNRSYANIPPHLRRNGRICGSALSIKSKLLLIYGLLTFKTGYMYLWLMLHALIFLLELTYWFWNLCTRKQTFCLKTFLMLLLLAIQLLMVHYIKTFLDKL